jgi:hypothetical protein
MSSLFGRSDAFDATHAASAMLVETRHRQAHRSCEFRAMIGETS